MIPPLYNYKYSFKKGVIIIEQAWSDVTVCYVCVCIQVQQLQGDMSHRKNKLMLVCRGIREFFHGSESKSLKHWPRVNKKEDSIKQIHSQRVLHSENPGTILFLCRILGELDLESLLFLFPLSYGKNMTSHHACQYSRGIWIMSLICFNFWLAL